MNIDRNRVVQIIDIVEEAVELIDSKPEELYAALECILTAMREKYGFSIKVGEETESVKFPGMPGVVN